ncbi:hypothetical protein INT48_003937 [Thamnidium elegans]|uniref:Nucleoporin Nup54 alpha-helical domain-containing protein n=1 Tax=Thamnidium elegans TaxID=101142 RepID=A0A8H7ST25_9FUNG|nr:hypothetical protein INT48_003937 [Thamnidium elegans]
MSFSFGAQPASTGFGGGFGQPATSTPFGQPATSTPFGQPATSTPFGQPATSTPFGQQQQQATPFGQQATAGFGQPAATSTPFGQTVTSAPFGQSATGFGQPATSTPFGQPATTGFGQATPSPFGQASTSAAPSTGFSFNSTFAPKPTTTFGTNTSSLFGANKPIGGGFGTTANLQQQQQQQQQRDQQIYQLLAQVDEESRKASAPSITSDQYEPENVWHALAVLKSWWDPKSPNCRFKHYFYNVVAANEVQLYQKPADQDQAQWDEAQKVNPDKTTMVPALAVGFEDVEKRMEQQRLLCEAHNAKLVLMQDILKKVQLKDMLETATKLAEYKRRHMEAAQRVIKFLKYTQVLRNKGLSITPEEEEMRTRFENIQDQLQRSEQFHGKLSQLWAQLQLIKESGRKYGKIDGVDEWDAVSENDMRCITKILEEQDNGVQHIIEVIKKDTTDIDMLRKGWRGDLH